nr:hypothetical protein HGMM_F01C09C41 [uncultured Gammaproteobacteria bacterium]BAL54497.1 hypothetical protein HGMM_F16E07C04 [uncultured Gammaproteobacteria bacterium]
MPRIGWLLATWLVAGLSFGHEGHGHDDKIGGVPLADFRVNELRIPCVEVQNLDPSVDGQFFDVILDRRGNSMNFELKFAEVENPQLCQAIADFAKFHDDFEDAGDATRILVICERRQSRSKVSVNAESLIAGRYAAQIVSGASVANSALKGTEGDEVEFDFDSDPADIAEGATAIAPDFIQGTVSAKILNEAGETVVAVDSVPCLNK